MNKDETISCHLTLKGVKGEDNLTHYSTLCAALKDARKMTGRNIETGAKDSDNLKDLGNWLGAMGYITILDQIGKCYIPQDKLPLEKTKSAIIKALNYFSNLTDLEIDVLYALRNAFFHDFSLINKDNPKNIHQFKVDNHPTNPIVVLPKNNWDGDINSIIEENATYVNLQKLGDLVEDIYKRLLGLSKIHVLNIELDGQENEIARRYLVVTG
jgi:hypothetical protein